jgi:membrane-associated HD superfamily phosphohydrolase
LGIVANGRKNDKSEVVEMRNRLKKVMLLAILLQVLVNCSIINVWGAEAARPDELWEHAVRIAAENQSLVPGNVHIHIEEANGKGKVKKVEESWTKFYPDENDTVKVKLIKQLENGKDVTERQQKEEKKGEKKQVQYKMELSDDLSTVFKPEIQPNITLKRLNRIENMDNRQCVVYEYKIITEAEGTITGTAWLSETGVPVAVKYTINPLPKKQSKYLKVASHEIHYHYLSDNCWYPQQASVKLKVKALFWEWNVKCDATFSDYWKKSGKL